jgi:cell wall-associated NlpC family hydrolase
MLVLFRFRLLSGSPGHMAWLKARLVLVALPVISLLIAAVGANANPSIREKRAQAAAVLTQVRQLDEEVADAAERWNGANYRLGQIQQQLDTTKRYLRFARKQVRVSQARLSARVRQLYIEGERASPVEVILGASSVDEILDLLDANRRLAAQDQRIATRLNEYRKSVAGRARQLTATRAQQAEVVRRRAAEREAIEARLAERERLLASIRDEVRRLEAEERRRQEEARRRALAELARQRRAAEAAALARQTAANTSEQSAFEPMSTQTPIAPALPPDASKSAQVVAIAMQYLGIPYRWGAASPSDGFDCSGLTMYVFAQVGVSLPHYAAAQYGLGVPVSQDDLQPGDLVFFRGLGHMGMYIGGGNFIHAPHTGDVVKISSLSESYYVATWVGARRVL